MVHHISEIILDDRFERYKITGLDSQYHPTLHSLAKVNIFVGANNSGKSRFLRLLSGTEKLTFKLNQRALTAAKECQSDFQAELEKIYKAHHIQDAENIKATLKGFPSLDQLVEGAEDLQKFSGLLNNIIQRRDLQSVTLEHGAYHADHPKVLQDIQKVAQQTQGRFGGITKEIEKKYEFAKIYVPMLRGLRDFPDFKNPQALTAEPYDQRTRKDYFSKGFAPEIWTGLALYKRVQELLLGDLKSREIIAEFQQFLSDNFFEQQPVALIPKLDKTVLDIKIGNEAERAIFEHGDGIQSLLLLTFPLFWNRGKKLLFFCEEPEMNLHPAMQRAFLKLLTSPGLPDSQYFLTTHSNHFLDLTADFKEISIYTFRKDLDQTESRERDAIFHVENVSSEDRRSLELLGVRNSSVFLANCTIWVEGITDRRYFKHYLKLYQQHNKELRQYREDLHYSFVEYGGACITHWSFLESDEDAIKVENLCGKLFLIADGDTGTNWKAERHTELERKLGRRYYRLRCREVENLIPPATLIATLKGYGEAQFKHFTQDDYKDQPLGKFIEESVIEGQRKRLSKYASPGAGTITSKTDFCDRAVAALQSYDAISNEAKQLIERLYEFIAQNNQ